MTRPFAALSILAIALSVAAAAKPKFTAKWKAPDARNLSFAGQKVVGLIVSDDMALRMNTEEALARELTAKGVQGVAAYRLIPAEEIRDKDRAKDWFQRAGAAGVVIMRLVNLTAEQMPSVVMWQSGVQYGSLWSYYPYVWGASFNLTPSRTNVTLVVETLAFDVAGNRLLWAGTSETTNPEGAQALVKSLVDAAGDEMRRDGLIRRK
jgi:hypothetical protein